MKSRTQALAKRLIENDIVKVQPQDPFLWSSGLRSPLYCDCRLLTGHVEAREAMVKALISQIEQMGGEVEAVAGTATAGISWASFVADRLRIPMVYVRSKPKAHGAGKMIEGSLKARSRVLVIEDLVSTGGSSLTSVKALQEEADAEVLGVLSLMSYGLKKAKEAFRESQIHQISLVSIEDVLPLLHKQGRLTEEQVSSVESFLLDPQAWQG